MSNLRSSIYVGVIYVIRDSFSPLLRDNTIRCQPQYVQPAIAHQAKVRRAGYSYPRVEERRVFDTVALVSLRATFEHIGNICNVILELRFLQEDFYSVK